MHFTTILPLALCALVTAAPLQKRDAATVLSDICSISSDVSTLDGEVNAYTGSSSQALAIVSSINCLENTLQTATNDATSSDAFSEADSESIANAISTLTSSIITLLSDLDAKHDTVAAANDTSVVESALNRLIVEADDFLTAVTDQVTESEESAIGTSSDEINYAFNQAITTYSS